DVNEKEIIKVKKKLLGKKGLLKYSLSKEVLESLGISVPKKIVFKTAEEIIMHKIYDNKNYVLKVDSKSLIHKKDIGGVVLGINKNNFRKEAIWLFGNVMNKSDDFTITLEEEVKGSETIVGLKSDEDLGNFIMFGMGGTFVSIFKDVNFALCPLTEKTAINLVQKSKVYEILKGFRGSKPIQFEKLLKILIRLSYLQKIYPEIKEVDFNPLICNSKGAFAVDVKLIL
ncbi:MAG: acetate--CoA ligase family protein, partial [Nanoarchaeota archaeon]|nr:acetate--CoA ligase family protein [Nanoarchaeota archaeon]